MDWTVNLGSILNIITLLGVALVGAKKIGVVEFKLNLMWNWFQREHGLNGRGEKD